MKEKWRRVPGWPDYEVSNLGRVRRHVVKVLTSWASKDRYPSVCLPRGQRRYIHRIVLEAFVGKAGEGQEARHLDGNRGNARLDNLKWGSRHQNMADRVSHGTSNRGERSGAAKLTNAQVADIRARYVKRKVPQRVLAREYGVGLTTINQIIHARTWKHIGDTALMKGRKE